MYFTSVVQTPLSFTISELYEPLKSQGKTNKQTIQELI